jgi:hypothetical protein
MRQMCPPARVGRRSPVRTTASIASAPKVLISSTTPGRKYRRFPIAAITLAARTGAGTGSAVPALPGRRTTGPADPTRPPRAHRNNPVSPGPNPQHDHQPPLRCQPPHWPGAVIGPAGPLPQRRTIVRRVFTSLPVDRSNHWKRAYRSDALPLQARHQAFRGSVARLSWPGARRIPQPAMRHRFGFQGGQQKGIAR